MKAPRRKLFLAMAALLVLPLVGLSSLRWAGEEKPPLRGVFADSFELLERPLSPPSTAFQQSEGGLEREVTLQDFAGRVVLLNFWATWCAPCVREMPSLARLEHALGGEGLSVVAVSTDREGIAQVAPFYEQHGLEALAVYLDPQTKLAEAMAVRGLPTTFLLDRKGHVVGRLEGPAEWDGSEALALVRYYLEQEPKTLPTEDRGRDPLDGQRVGTGFSLL